MKLFCAPGTMSLLPHIVLLEAGLAFTQIRIDEFTKAIEGGGDYRTVNPLGYVPALLLDDGTLLTEGAAIVQYVADQVPAKGLAPPNGTIERTKLQAWLNFFSSEMHKGSYAPIFHKGLSEDAKEIFRDRLRSRYAHLDRHLADHEYFMARISRLRTRTRIRSRTGRLASALISRPIRTSARTMRAWVAAPQCRPR
jgi:glutathione S-transferase